MASRRRGPDDLSPTSGDGGRLEETPDPEVSERPRRRRYTTEYKLSILAEADAASAPGEIAALLRREGLYSSLLSVWRRQREEGALDAPSARKRGRRTKPVNPLTRRVQELEREKRELQRQLEQARAVIGIQKKLSEILAPQSPAQTADEST